MADTLEPIDWQAVKPQAVGPRHYTGAEIHTHAAWNCPACGQENLGALGEGCTHCGSGGGAKHVGVDPIVRKGDRPAGRPRPTTPSPVFTQTFGDVQQAFLVWMQQAGAEVGPLAAFVAGWTARGMDMTAAPQQDTTAPGDTEAAAGSEPLVLPGTPQSRTILAALILFRDQIMSQQPEEATTGEWLTTQELEDLIHTLEKEHA